MTSKRKGQDVRALPMTSGALPAPKCHNHAVCNRAAKWRIQYFGLYGWVTRYYECDGWKCQEARNIKDCQLEAVNV